MSRNKQKATTVYGISDWAADRDRPPRSLALMKMEMEMAAIRIQAFVNSCRRATSIRARGVKHPPTQIYYLPTDPQQSLLLLP